MSVVAKPSGITHSGAKVARRACIRVQACLLPIMVNSCTGKMGHAAAEALVAHGFPLVPHTLSGLSAGVAVSNIGVRGLPVQLVGNEKRQLVLETIKTQYPKMMVVDYTLAHCAEDHVQLYADNGLPFVMGTVGGDRGRMRRAADAAGVYAVLSSPAGDQATSLFALLTSLGAPLPTHFEDYTYEAVGGADDADALDLLWPAAAPDIVLSLQEMGIQCDEAQVHRMRSARQQRVAGQHLERDAPPTSLRALQGRGKSRTCRITGPGGHPALLLRHYGLDRVAFAAGAVEAARFLAARVEEGASQRLYDMVDVLRAVQAARAGQPGAPHTGNVVATTNAMARMPAAV